MSKQRPCRWNCGRRLTGVAVSVFGAAMTDTAGASVHRFYERKQVKRTDKPVESIAYRENGKNTEANATARGT